MCKVTDAQIVADDTAVATAVTSIADAVEATNPTLAADLTAAAHALAVATTNWKTGTPVTDINTAAAAIQAILGEIPLTAPYADFVAIAVAAIDILIGNLSTQSTQSVSAVANALAAQAHIETLPENPWRGLVKIKRHVFEGPRAALIRTWNDQTEKQPQLGFARL